MTSTEIGPAGLWADIQRRAHGAGLTALVPTSNHSGSAGWQRPRNSSYQLVTEAGPAPTRRVDGCANFFRRRPASRANVLTCDHCLEVADEFLSDKEAAEYGWWIVQGPPRELGRDGIMTYCSRECMELDLP